MALPQDEWHVVFFRPPMRIPAGAFSTTLLAIIPLFCGLFASAGPVGAQIIATVAGDGTAGYSGDGGPATSASLHNPVAVAVDSAGNFYIAEELGNRIRKVSGGTIATVAGNGTAGFSGDGGPATSASLGNPYGVAVDVAGDLYIADQQNQRIRKVSGGTITTVAGNGNFGFSGDGGPATRASLSYPAGVAVDSAGSLYIADSFNNRIRKVSGGTITTVAGNGNQGFSGDGGPATSASLFSPVGVAVDSAGNLYIAEGDILGNSRIRKVSGGIIATVAGNGIDGFSGDGGPATSASLDAPIGMAVDSAGNLYIADAGTNRIRKVSGGTITTVAGNGTANFSGDGGLATSASFNFPTGVALGSAGSLYIADINNERIREVLAQSAPAPSVTSAGVVNAASFQSGAVAPGEIISIFGAGIGPAAGTLWQIVNGMAPTTLAQTRVLFSGAPAPLIYVSAKQINAVVPYEVAGQSTVSMQVSYQGSLSNSVSLNVAATAPALFTVASSGSGGGAILNQDYSLNTAANPAAAGSVVQIFATGEGVTTPASADGKLNNQPLGPTFPMPAAHVSATIGGQPATVQFAGTAPGGVAGFLQVNASVPNGLPAGPAPIVLKVGNASSPAGVTVAVQGQSAQRSTLTVTTAGSGAGTVVSSPAGISCGATCSASFTLGTVVTLTATPNSGSAFGGWSGACSGAGGCTVTMNSSQAATATFNLSVAPTISISISPAAATIQTGGTQQFTATVIGTTNTAATWSVNGMAGGDSSAGTISSSGLYTAPASVPSSNTVTIAATSVANPSAAASAMLLINPACQVPAAAMTDANGTATLCAGGFVFPIQLTDVDSGQPIASGLAVSAAVDPALPGRAIVLIADPAQNYPLQFVLLDSPPAAGATAARREAAADRQAQASGSTIAVPAQSGTAAVLTAVIQALQTGLLPGAFPAPKPNTQSFANTFLTVVQEMTNSSQVLLPPPLSGALPSVTTSSPVSIAEYRQSLVTQVGADAAQNLLTWYLTLFDEGMGGLYGGLAAAVTVDIMDDVLATYYQEIGASSVVTETIRFGGIAVQIPLPDFTAPIQNIIPPKPNLNITVQAPNGSAVSKGSVQLVSSGDLGLGILGNVGGNGLAAIPAPPGPYTARVDSLGFQPQTQNVTVPALGGTSLSFALQFLPQPVALSFNPVTPVPAMLGMPYLFSFCAPPLTNPAQLCEVPPATNPSGGQPPYHFQLATLGGFPPMGISLSLNGLLTGAAKTAGTTNFQVCAVDLSGASVCQPVSLTVDPVLTITTSGDGTVGSSPQGTPCGSGCFGFAPETVVTLTATPNTGSTFTGWSGACSGTGLCTVTMGSSQTVTATFSGAAGGMTLVSNTPFTCVATSGFGMNCSGSVTTNISLPMAAGTALAVIVSSSIDGSFFPSASVTTTQSPPGNLTFPIQASVLSCPAAQTDLDLYQVIDGVVTGPSLASVSGLNISFACP